MKSHQHHYYLHQNESLVISGYTPTSPNQSKTAVIWAPGALGAGDLGERTFPTIALEKQIAFFYPDYYGSFRSSGSFTIKNCVQTILDTIVALRNNNLKRAHHNALEDTTETYTNILCVFSSFAGWIPWWIHHHMADHPLLPHLQNIAWHCPLLDIERQANGEFPGEESLSEFLFLGQTVFAETYRGIEQLQWREFLGAKDPSLIPLQQLVSLTECHTSIVHGTKDHVISHTRSVEV